MPATLVGRRRRHPAHLEAGLGRAIRVGALEPRRDRHQRAVDADPEVERGVELVAVEHDLVAGRAVAEHLASQRVGVVGGQFHDRREHGPQSRARRAGTVRVATVAASAASCVTQSAVVAVASRMLLTLDGEAVVELTVEPGQRLVEQQQLRLRGE